MILRTSRLVLRDFAPGDLASLERYQGDERYRRYYPTPPEGDLETHALLDRFIAWQEERPRSRFQLAIADPSSSGLLGTVGLRRRTPESRVAELGYELAPWHWGQGYATEAARALVAFGFAELRLHRVQAHCIADNRASARVAERLGLRREGVFREHEFFAGRWWDVEWYGILAAEWTPSGPRSGA